MASSERFGYEWGKYSYLTPIYETQLKAWISPLSEKDFVGKRLLDAGCGMGRNSYWPLTWGAKEVLAFDLDPRSVESAKANLAKFKNAKIETRSIYDIKWQNQFDLVLCVGVLHHLKWPIDALVNLYRALTPNGKLILWVYGYEGNEWIVRYVSPVRKLITSRLPVGVVHFLSYFVSIPLWIYLKLAKPRSGYLATLSQFIFWHMHSIVFDQLIPKIANYWTREEVEKLLQSADIHMFTIHKTPTGTGWTVIAEKANQFS